MKCIVLKPSHIQGFLCNFKIERDISISFGKKWSWPPCIVYSFINLTFLAHISYYYHILDIKTGPETCGGKGGNGGDGGLGGAAGLLKINGNSGLVASVNQLESDGGTPGLGAVGGDGIIANSRYKGYYSKFCEIFLTFTCNCGKSAYGGYDANTSQDEFCPGDAGQSGNPGKPWTP